MKFSRIAGGLVLLAASLWAGSACMDFHTAYEECVQEGRCADPTSSDAGQPDAGGGVDAGAPEPGELGYRCTDGAACDSGFCVDGVCCDSEPGACSGCRACNVPGSLGTCTALPEGSDPHDVCAEDPSACEGGSCDGKGSCAPSSNGTSCGPAFCNGNELDKKECADGLCTPSPLATCQTGCTGDHCNEGCTPGSEAGCDAGKWCNWDTPPTCVPKRNDGVSCGDGIECQSGNCVDGVCCGSVFCGGCEACNLIGEVGHCAPLPVNAPPSDSLCSLGAGDCVTGACAGDGGCQVRTSGSCGSGMLSCDGQDVQAEQCNAAGSCVPTTEFTCDAGTSCYFGSCVAGPGSPCGQQSDCSSPFGSLTCVQGVCCAASCGACQRCAGPGFDTCSTIPGCTAMDGGTDGGSDGGIGSDGGDDAGCPMGDGGPIPCGTGITN